MNRETGHGEPDTHLSKCLVRPGAPSASSTSRWSLHNRWRLLSMSLTGHHYGPEWMYAAHIEGCRGRFRRRPSIAWSTATAGPPEFFAVCHICFAT